MCCTSVSNCFNLNTYHEIFDNFVCFLPCTNRREVIISFCYKTHISSIRISNHGWLTSEVKLWLYVWVFNNIYLQCIFLLSGLLGYLSMGVLYLGDFALIFVMLLTNRLGLLRSNCFSLNMKFSIEMVEKFHSIVGNCQTNF